MDAEIMKNVLTISATTLLFVVYLFYMGSRIYRDNVKVWSTDSVLLTVIVVYGIYTTFIGFAKIPASLEIVNNIVTFSLIAVVLVLIGISVFKKRSANK